jgi:hypothetical protein
VARVSPVPLEIDRQRNRLNCTEAITKAKASADARNLSRARQIIDEAVAAITRSATAAEEMTQRLITDLKDCIRRMEDAISYAATGHQTMTSYVGTHTMQRSCGTSMAYQTRSKRDTVDNYRSQN